MVDNALVDGIMMLHRPRPPSSTVSASRSSVSSGCISRLATRTKKARFEVAPVHAVVPQDVADVLAQEPLDALTELTVVLAPEVVVAGKVEPAVRSAGLAAKERCARDGLRDGQHVAHVAAQVPAVAVGRTSALDR